MTRLFIGGLKEGASRTELEREFENFGPLREVWVARKPPGFGFVLFEESRDADDALREMNGQYVCGGRIRVEYARDSGEGRGRGGGSGGGGGGSGRGGGVRGGGNPGECYNCGQHGHYGRDCRKGSSSSGGGGGGHGGRRRSRSRSRSCERDRRQRRTRRSRSHSR